MASIPCQERVTFQLWPSPFMAVDIASSVCLRLLLSLLTSLRKLTKPPWECDTCPPSFFVILEYSQPGGRVPSEFISTHYSDGIYCLISEMSPTTLSARGSSIIVSPSYNYRFSVFQKFKCSQELLERPSSTRKERSMRYFLGLRRSNRFAVIA